MSERICLSVLEQGLIQHRALLTTRFSDKMRADKTQVALAIPSLEHLPDETIRSAAPTPSSEMRPVRKIRHPLTRFSEPLQVGKARPASTTASSEPVPA